MAMVLVTGRDKALVETRKLVLEKAGHTVFTATSEPEVINLCRQHDFDVAVIGQNVSAKEKRRILGLVRQYSSSARILELYPVSHGRALESADGCLPVPTDVPQEIADRVAALATRPAARSKRQSK